MKKILILIFSMLLIGSLSFAADTATLEINVSVPAVHDVKISTSDASNVGQYNAATALPSTSIGYNELVSGTFYMLVKTNDRLGLKIQAKLEHLKAASPVTTKIKYFLKSGATLLGTSETVGTNYVTLLEVLAAPGNGLRVVSRPFLVELYSDTSGMSTDSAEASAVGEYSTTITFELVTL